MLKANLPQNTSLPCPDDSSEARKETSDSAVDEIIKQEHKYKRELWRLQKIIRRTIASDDPLPLFNRRHLLMLVQRLCKDIDYSTSRMYNNMDMSSLSCAIEAATQVPHYLLCVAYCDAIFEMRDLLKRESSRKNDKSISFCTLIHAERALLPLHRLKYFKAISCFSQQNNDSLSTALDGCFEVLASLHSQDYVTEIDNLLDLGLVMCPPPKLPQENVLCQNDYNEIVQFKKFDEPKDEHLYEEIEMVAVPKPTSRGLSELFFNNNKRSIKNVILKKSRFTVSTTELCS